LFTHGDFYDNTYLVIKIKEVLKMIKDISVNYDVVGLTVAEHLPDIEIKIRNILSELPLMND
jgi:arginase